MSEPQLDAAAAAAAQAQATVATETPTGDDAIGEPDADSDTDANATTTVNDNDIVDAGGDSDEELAAPVRSTKQRKRNLHKRKRDAVALGLIDDEVEVSTDEDVSDDEKDDDEKLKGGFIENLVAESSADEDEDDSEDSDADLTKDERRAKRERRRERKRLKRQRLGLKPKEHDVDEDDLELLQEAGVNVLRNIDDDIDGSDTESSSRFRRIKKGVALPTAIVPTKSNGASQSTFTASNNVVQGIDDVLADDDDDMNGGVPERSGSHHRRRSSGAGVGSAEDEGDEGDDVEGEDLDDEPRYEQPAVNFNNPLLTRLFGQNVGAFFTGGRTGVTAQQPVIAADTLMDEAEADEEDEELDSDGEPVARKAKTVRRKQTNAAAANKTMDATTRANIRIQALSEWLDRVRTSDIPERQQARVARRQQIAQQYPSHVSVAEELNEEAAWIYEHHFTHKEPTVDAIITKILHYIRVDHFEVPYILLYKRDDLEGQFTEDEVWYIDELDDRYDELASKRLRLLAQARQFAADDGRLIDTITYDWKTATDLEDVQDYVHFLMQITTTADSLAAATQDQLSLTQQNGAIPAPGINPADPLAIMNKVEHSITATAEGTTATESDDVIRTEINLDGNADNPIQVAVNIGDDIAAITKVDSLSASQPTRTASITPNGVTPSQQVNSTRTLHTRPELAFVRQIAQTPLAQLSATIGITGRQLADNIKGEWRQHEKADEPYTLEAEAAKQVSGKYADVDAVLRDVRKFTTLSLAFDVKLRKYIRHRYQNFSLITTRATPKGQREIADESHTYYHLKALKLKPIERFKDCSQWLLIEKAESEGYITVEVALPPHDHTMEDAMLSKQHSPLYALIASVYLSRRHAGSDAERWDQQRRLVVEDLVNNHLTKMGNTHVRQHLRQQASDYVNKSADKRLNAILRSGSFQPTGVDLALPQNKHLRNFRTISIVYGAHNSPSSLVVLSKYGNVVDHAVFHFLKSRAEAIDRKTGLPKSDEDRRIYARKKQDITAFNALLTQHKPALITLDANSEDAINFKNELENKLLVDFPNIRVEFVDSTYGRLFATSERSQREFKDFPNDLRIAISNGRFALDPISEVAAMWSSTDYDQTLNDIATSTRKGNNAAVDSAIGGLSPTKNDILSLQLHPMQSFVSKDQLLRTLTNRMIRVVNHVGVDINKVISRNFLYSTLQFVCGLGPIKAKALIQFGRQRGYICSREELSKAKGGLFGETVYNNTIGFIRIHQLRIDASEIRTHYGAANYSAFDDTRIHPQHYEQAFQVVEDALDDEDGKVSEVSSDDSDDDDDDEEGEEKDADVLKVQRATQRKMNKQIRQLQQPKHISRLETLDLDAYAQILKEETGEQMQKLLSLVKSELRHPFMDADGYTSNLKSLTKTRLFQLITGQTDQSMHVGMVVPAVVVNLLPNGAIVKLEEGMRGFIRIIELSDSLQQGGERLEGDQAKEFIEQRLSLGQTVECRVLKVNIARFNLDLATRSSQLVDFQPSKALSLWEDERREFQDEADHDLEHWQLYDEYNTYTSRREEEEAKAAEAAASKPMYTPRNIIHSIFKNVDKQQALAFLHKAPVGDCVVRPATGRVNHLTLTWKIDEDVYWHLDITELNKTNPYELGKQLVLNTSKPSPTADPSENTYDDIDEILVRYIDPCNRLIRELVENKKFRHGDLTDIDEMLRAEKASATSSHIPYAVHFAGYGAETKAGGFLFSCLARDRVKRIQFTITSDGLKFNNKLFPSTDAVVSAIKRTLAGNAQPQQPAQPAQQARPTQYAPHDPRQHARAPPAAMPGLYGQQPAPHQPPAIPIWVSQQQQQPPPIPQQAYPQQSYQFPPPAQNFGRPQPPNGYGFPPPPPSNGAPAFPPQRPYQAAPFPPSAQYPPPQPQQPYQPPPAQPAPARTHAPNTMNPARAAMLSGR